MDDEEDFYKSLKIKLVETTTFPTKYMFKFIIPNNTKKIESIESMFNYLGAVITSKTSKSNKYKSLTVLVKMDSVEQIINKYVEVDTVEGVISL